MMSKRVPRTHKGAVLEGVEPALRRSQRRAKDIAARTGTPLVIYRDGKIERQMTTGGRSKAK